MEAADQHDSGQHERHGVENRHQRVEDQVSQQEIPTVSLGALGRGGEGRGGDERGNMIFIDEFCKEFFLSPMMRKMLAMKPMNPPQARKMREAVLASWTTLYPPLSPITDRMLAMHSTIMATRPTTPRMKAARSRDEEDVGAGGGAMTPFCSRCQCCHGTG